MRWNWFLPLSDSLLNIMMCLWITRCIVHTLWKGKSGEQRIEDIEHSSPFFLSKRSPFCCPTPVKTRLPYNKGKEIIFSFRFVESLLVLWLTRRMTLSEKVDVVGLWCLLTFIVMLLVVSSHFLVSLLHSSFVTHSILYTHTWSISTIPTIPTNLLCCWKWEEEEKR